VFSARQEKDEGVASWGSRIDEMQADLTETARRVGNPEEVQGTVGLIDVCTQNCPWGV
jgi:hypothetical protein